MQQNLKELLGKIERLNSELKPIQDSTKKINEQLAEAEAEIRAILADPIKQARQLAGKDTGTVDVLVQGVMVKHCVGKNVVWDQEKLIALRKRIAEANDNPDKYMNLTTTYKVSEKEFKAFPEPVKELFAEARETKPGKPKVTFDLNWR